jgi:hypothetical protein
MDLAQLLDHSPELMVMTIPIVAILSGTVMGVLRHRERMAMIEHGMDPDAVKKAKMLARQEEVPRLERR